MTEPSAVSIPLGPLPRGSALRLRLRGVHHQATPLAAEVFLLPDGQAAIGLDVHDGSYVGRLGLYGQGDFAVSRQQEVVAGLEPFDVLFDAAGAATNLRPGTPVSVVVVPDPGAGADELQIDGAALEPFPH